MQIDYLEFRSVRRRSGLVVSALISGSRGPDSSPDRGHCCVLRPHSAPLHPGVQIGTGELNAGGNHAMD